MWGDSWAAHLGPERSGRARSSFPHCLPLQGGAASIPRELPGCCLRRPAGSAEKLTGAAGPQPRAGGLPLAEGVPGVRGEVPAPHLPPGPSAALSWPWLSLQPWLRAGGGAPVRTRGAVCAVSTRVCAHACANCVCPCALGPLPLLSWGHIAAACLETLLGNVTFIHVFAPKSIFGFSYTEGKPIF